MKASKIFKLQNPLASSHFTYDPHSDSLLVSGQSLFIASKEAAQDADLLKPSASFVGHVSKDLPWPYLSFIPSNDSDSVLTHSRLSLTCTNLSGNYRKFPLNQNFTSGIHYFEVVCPISCGGIAFGIQRNEGTTVSLKLYTTTPRTVGVLVDLEHCVFALHVDGELNAPVKQEKIFPAIWTPFIKLKSKGNKENTVIIDPFTARWPNGVACEGYLSAGNHLAAKYANTVVLLSPPESVNELKPLAEFLAFKNTEHIKHWAISKEKTSKQTRVALIELGSRKDKDLVIRYVGKNVKSGEELLRRVRKALDMERIGCETYLEASFKRKRPSEVKPDLAPRTEDEKAEDIKEYKRQVKSLFKSCLAEFNEKVLKTYRESVDSLLKEQNIKAHKEEVKNDTATQAFYLSNTDNLLLANGSLLKLVHKTSGEFKIPATSFYNSPETVDSYIGIALTKMEASFLLKNMKWKGLGSYMQEANCMSVYNFLHALMGCMKDKAEDCLIFVKYADAKAFVDVGMRGICLEKLCRSSKFKPDMRIFMRTTDDILEHLTNILCKMEEMLWSMVQSHRVDNSLRSFWSESTLRLQASYMRLLSFQGSQNRSSSEVVLAEAGLMLKEDKLVHYEDPSVEVGRNVCELAGKESVEELWKELRSQLPDNKFLAGRVTANVPLCLSLIHICRCRRYAVCRSRWSPYH
eukprot:TRINITY_DN7487_c0_g1_i6.p1 TRINITY_DN7487_c0_g1~~TRINITY_DN7487_c0_g1_i6.p1  ORF type:complete len:690 (-),score=104.20 TRINITY_DN7487_c0_g1_i6:20-2089(-)